MIGFRPHEHDEITKTHIDRLVTVEEVKTYDKNHRGKRTWHFGFVVLQ